MQSILNFLRSSCNLITVILSVILSLVFWVVSPFESIPMWVFIFCLFIIFFLIWALTISLLALKNNSPLCSSAILICNQDGCICNKTAFLTMSAVVSIYLSRNDIEHLIGYAEVTNIQDNGFVCLKIHKLPDTVVSQDPLPFYQIISNHKEKILIKPNITPKIIENISMKEH